MPWFFSFLFNFTLLRCAVGCVWMVFKIRIGSTFTFFFNSLFQSGAVYKSKMSASHSVGTKKKKHEDILLCLFLQRWGSTLTVTPVWEAECLEMPAALTDMYNPGSRLLFSFCFCCTGLFTAFHSVMIIKRLYSWKLTLSLISSFGLSLSGCNHGPKLTLAKHQMQVKTGFVEEIVTFITG